MPRTCGFWGEYRTPRSTPPWSICTRKHADRVFTVVGIPCNQFGGQEPGTSEEIAEFCSATYGVTFPMTEKADVNGNERHAFYDELTAGPDADGETGDVQWNF